VSCPTSGYVGDVSLRRGSLRHATKPRQSKATGQKTLCGRRLDPELNNGITGNSMAIIDYKSSLKVLVSVKGHPFQRDEFCSLLSSFDDIACTEVEQPANQVFLNPENAADWDALCFYDMPGIDFSEQPPVLIEPSEAMRVGMLRLLEKGKGMVFLHHALASWPLWPEYGEIIGGRFFYRPAQCRGEPVLDSGYLHDTEHEISVLAPQHPVCRGVDSRFSLTDELYLAHAFDDSIIPLLGSNYDFRWQNFSSALHAVTGRMYCNDNWPHPDGTPLVGWVKHYKNSPIVYLQPGDGPSAYADPNYRRLLENALRWVASDEAMAWARQRNQSDHTLL